MRETSLHLMGVIRLSTDEQAREGRAGIDRQRADIERIRQQTGANIVRIIEVIESGSFVRDQVDFQQLFDDLSRPGVDGVATSSVDRLVRPDKFADFIIFDYFRANGKKIYTPGSVIDPASQSGFIEALIRGGFSGMEKQFIRDRTMSAKEALRKKKRAIGGITIPDGVLFDSATGVRSYDLDPDRPLRKRCTHEPEKRRGKPRADHPGFALNVREAFRLLVEENYSLRAISNMALEGRHVMLVKRLLMNPIWIGIRRYDRQAAGDFRMSRGGIRYRYMAPRAEPFEVRVIEEPLIPVAMFERAQEILGARKIEWGKRERRGPCLTSGLLQCECGRSVYVNHSSGGKGSGHLYQRCGSQKTANPCGLKGIRNDVIERAILYGLRDQLLTVEVIDSIVAASQRTQAESHTDTRKRELERLKKTESDFLSLLHTRDITADQFREHKRRLSVERLALDLRCPEEAPPSWNDPDIVRDMLATAFVQLPFLPPQHQRDLLHRAVRRIIISGQGIHSLTLSGGFLSEFTIADVGKLSPRSTEKHDRRVRV